MRIISFACVFSSVLLLNGCGVFEKVKHDQSVIESEISEVDLLRSQMRDLLAAHAVQVSKPAAPKAKPATLPDKFNGRVFHAATDETLDAVLVEVSRQSGLPVWLTEFAQDSRQNLGDMRISFQYEGTLQGLFDHLAQITKLHWRYVSGRVEFFLYETRHFYVNVPMGARSVSANISSTGDKSKASDSDVPARESTGQIRVNTDGIAINPYEALRRTISAMLVQDLGRGSGAQRKPLGASRGATPANSSLDGELDDESPGFLSEPDDSRSSPKSRDTVVSIASQVVITPEMGMLTVTAPPSSLDRIATYIDDVNRRFTQNVMIDVKIYDVAVSDASGGGFSVDLLYRKLGDYGIQFSNGSMGVMGGTTDTAPSILSRFAGSQAIVRALSSFGRISSVTSGQVIAVNGQPSPLQIGSEITYLSGTETLDRGTSVTGSRLDTHLVTKQISVGLTANFLPQVLADNLILLQYQLTSRALAGMSTITGSDGNSIQLPTVTSQTLQQQAFVRDGESIVLFGIEQNSASASGNQGMPLTVNRDTSKERNLRVIVMQVFGASVNQGV